ncbi:MAG TPA: DinB family protein [Chloroflexia bacterium]|nr:DinB family protein [Chloroflexia bacterium]
MTNDTRHPKLLALLARGREDTLAFVAGLSPAQRSAEGTLARWSAKETIGHLSAWQVHTAQRLAAAVDGTEPPHVADEATFNDARFALDRQRDWPAVLADAERAYADLTAAVERCSEPDLTDPQRFPWTHGRALIGSVFGNGYAHVGEHLADYYLATGDTAPAISVQSGMAVVTEQIFGPSEYTAAARYNLGCFYARTGNSDAAIAALRAALTMDPRLVPWSRQDRDLNTLYNDPAFQALISS